MAQPWRDDEDIGGDGDAYGEAVVLVVGSCGLDRLLGVGTYPEADAKVRTTSYAEMGGGNAANTAAAMARLAATAKAFRSRRIRIKLCTKIGNDRIGTQVADELRASGVDLSSPLFRVAAATGRSDDSTASSTASTGLTTIVVSESPVHTRTCFYTPGTCGELTASDVADVVDMDGVFRNVVHVHSDSRHLDAALPLFEEASKRGGISLSIDVEKDRESEAFDALTAVAQRHDIPTIIFTSDSNHRKLRNWFERMANVSSFRDGTTNESGPENVQATEDRIGSAAAEDRTSKLSSSAGVSDADAQLYVRCLRPLQALVGSCYDGAVSTGASKEKTALKEVVVTAGHRGALHVVCDGASSSSPKVGGVARYDDSDAIKIVGASPDFVKIQHELPFKANIGPSETCVEISIRQVGVLAAAEVVDTTGAGDAFVGGYLLAHLFLDNFDAHSRLRLGSWVAGRKVGGPGAQSGLPYGDKDMDEALGTEPVQIQETLRSVVGTFQSISGRM